MTTTPELHPCGVRTRSGQPCRNLTTTDACPVHDPERTCGAPNGHGGTCRRVVEPGRRCDVHDELAVERRRADVRRQRDEEQHWRAAAADERRARQVEADALVAALADCAPCLSSTLRALVLAEPADPMADEEDAPPTAMAIAWEHVVRHLQLGHALVSR